MGARFWTADLHLGHGLVSEHRGFADVAQHDLAIVRAWQRQVRPDDEVFVLGDISSGRTEDHALEVLAALPGTKHLVAGNHDSVSGVHRRGFQQQGKFLEVFASVSDFIRIRHRKRDVLLSHYPYAEQGDGDNRGTARYLQYRLPDLGALLIHGHTHSTTAYRGRELCVSWDAWGELVTQQDVDDWVVSCDEVVEGVNL